MLPVAGLTVAVLAIAVLAVAGLAVAGLTVAGLTVAVLAIAGGQLQHGRQRSARGLDLGQREHRRRHNYTVLDLSAYRQLPSCSVPNRRRHFMVGENEPRSSRPLLRCPVE